MVRNAISEGAAEPCRIHSTVFHYQRNRFLPVFL